MMCQADFYKAQEILAKKLEVLVTPLTENVSENVKVLNSNRTVIISALEKRIGVPCEQTYYNLCGAILRAFYLYGLSEEEIVEGVDIFITVGGKCDNHG